MKFKLLFVVLCLASVLCAQEKTSEKENIKNSSELQQKDYFDFSRTIKAKNIYQFGLEYRIEIGYVQNFQHSLHKTYPKLHSFGGEIGAKIDLLLPYHFSVQVGFAYAITYGKQEQHFHSAQTDLYQIDYIINRITEHQFFVPAHIYYTQPLVKKWRMLFLGGPQMLINIAQINNPNLHLNTLSQQWGEENDIITQKTNLVQKKKIKAAALQMGVGIGFEWNFIRLIGRYDFGLTNLVKYKNIPDQHMWEWGLHVTVGIKLEHSKKNDQQQSHLIQ